MGGFLEGLEKFTGINIGVGDTKRALDDAKSQLVVQEGIVEARIKERDALKGTEDSLKALEKVSALNKIDIKLAALRGEAQDENVALALEELRTLDSTILAEKELLKTLESITGAKKNQEAIDRTVNTLQDLRVKKAQSEFNLAKATKDQGTKSFDQAQQAGGGLLGASRAGQQALDTARKVRARENKTADFKTQENVFGGIQEEENKKRAKQGLPPLTRMGIMEREAAKQAAGEAPSLSEKLLAGQTGQNPAQLAAEQAKGGGGADSQKQLLDAINTLSKKIPAAIAQG